MGGEEGSGRERGAGSIPEKGLTAGKIDDCYKKCCGLSGKVMPFVWKILPLVGKTIPLISNK